MELLVLDHLLEMAEGIRLMPWAVHAAGMTAAAAAVVAASFVVVPSAFAEDCRTGLVAVLVVVHVTVGVVVVAVA